MKKINEIVKKCELIENIGAKSKKPYIAVSLELVSGFRKMEFISQELNELIKLERIGGKKLGEVIKSCQVVERDTAKGEKYIAVEVILISDYKELVFLSFGTVEIIKVLRR